jgi:hypothetical protein
MPDDSSGKARVNDGWAGATGEQGGNLHEGWQPNTVKKGYQPSASTQPPSPPQGGSAVPPPSGSQGSGSSGEKR